LHVFFRFHPPKFSHNRFNPYFFLLLFFFFAKFSKLELFYLIQFFKNWIIMVSWPGSIVISVASSLFCFFFQFHPLILGWLRIRLHNFFRFAFYEVTPASWLGSRVWSINLSWLMWFFHVIFTCFFFFLQFHSSTLSWLRIEVYNLF
jgi:hypothetical protein